MRKSREIKRKRKKERDLTCPALRIKRERD